MGRCFGDTFPSFVSPKTNQSLSFSFHGVSPFFGMTQVMSRLLCVRVLHALEAFLSHCSFFDKT